MVFQQELQFKVELRIVGREIKRRKKKPTDKGIYCTMIVFRRLRIGVSSIRGVCTAKRRANLGEMTEYLESQAVPDILNRPIEDNRLNHNIQLRLLPSLHPYIPTLHGITKYKTSMNGIRLIIRNFVLNERCKLHVVKVETILREEEGEAGRKKYNTVSDMDKIVVKWQSCREECEHLGPGDVTSRAKMGSYKAMGETTATKSKIPQSNNAASEVINYIVHPTSPVTEKLMSQHAKLVAEDKWKISRVLTGVFIFELNEDNSEIVVHTIDNVEMIDDEKEVETGAFAC